MTRRHRLSLLLLLSAGVALSACCHQGQTVSERVPLGRTQESADRAWACFARCERLGAGNDTGIALCVRDCPGAIEEQSECPADSYERPRKTLCAQYTVAESEAAPKSARAQSSEPGGWDLFWYAVANVAYHSVTR